MTYHLQEGVSPNTCLRCGQEAYRAVMLMGGVAATLCDKCLTEWDDVARGEHVAREKSLTFYQAWLYSVSHSGDVAGCMDGALVALEHAERHYQAARALALEWLRGAAEVRDESQ